MESKMKGFALSAESDRGQLGKVQDLLQASCILAVKPSSKQLPEPELCCVIMGVLRAENLSDLPQTYKKLLKAAAAKVSAAPASTTKSGWSKLPPSPWSWGNLRAALNVGVAQRFLGQTKNSHCLGGALGSTEAARMLCCCWNLLVKVLKQFPILPPCCRALFRSHTLPFLFCFLLIYAVARL